MENYEDADCVITVGISCSGKSTLARRLVDELGFAEVNRDEIRKVLFGDTNLRNYKYSRKKEQDVTDAAKKLISHYAKHKIKVVVSDTNLNKQRLRNLVDFCTNEGYKNVLVERLEIDYAVACKRDLNRDYDKQVGSHVIGRQLSAFRDTSNKYIPDTTKPSAYIFDIDGTLADMKGIRSPYAWDKVGLDAPKTPVINVLLALQAAGHKIIIFSGRDGSCHLETSKWLRRNGISHDFLAMRPEGSNEKDVIVKSRMFGFISHKYNVLGVFDDRPVVCRMWADKFGLEVFALGNQHYEF